MHATQVALTCIDGKESHGALHWLLSDFVEATLAYSQLAAQTIKGAEMPPPEILTFNWSGKASDNTTSTQTLQTCDCLVVGCTNQDMQTAFDDTNRQFALLLEQLPPHAHVYTICSTDGPDPTLATPYLASLARVAQVRWMGGVAIGGAEFTAYLAHQPRMGILRRPISETLDTLIAAVRSQTTLKGQADSHLLYAHPGIPKVLWGLACKLLLS